MALDKHIFGDKTFSDLLQEIHENSTTTKTQIKALIGELKPLIENIGDATLLVPMIKEYLEISVKNDEQLIKMAAIIQRMESSSSKGGEDMFDPSELAALLEASDELAKESQQEETPEE